MSLSMSRLIVALDNNSTYKEKMKKLLKESLIAKGVESKLVVEFIHTPAYSPNFNLAEYEIIYCVYKSCITYLQM
jgi:hypothetical protein